MGQQNESQNHNPSQVQPLCQPGSNSISSRICDLVRSILQKHYLSIAVISVWAYVLFFVPQITNIWQQGPNRENDFTIWFSFWLYVYVLAGYYVGAVLIFNRESLKGPLIVFYPIERSLSLLTRAVSTRRSATIGLLLSAILCASVLAGLYFHVFDGRYSLSEIFWESTFLWLLATTCWFILWMLWYDRERTGPDDKMPELLRLAARYLSCLFVGYVFGEIIWWAASEQIWEISFRNYSLWGVDQTLIFFILMARGADKLSRNSQNSVRLQAIVGVLLFFLFAQPWMINAPDITAAKFVADSTDDEKPLGNEHPLAKQWQAYRHYDYLINRIEQTEKYEPVVFVAASGGGSRAAIFSALVLEGLAREPIVKGSTKTWADQIVLISSVSGGSLASAHFVQRGMRKSKLDEDGILQSVLRTDLVEELPKAAEVVSKWYAQDNSDKVPPQVENGGDLIRTIEEIEKNTDDFFKALQLHLKENPGVAFENSDSNSNSDLKMEAGKLGWIIDAEMIDEISLDFMAPLFRGSTSLITPRGKALRDFWTDKFDWNQSETGQEEEDSHPKVYPLLLFNATDVRAGSRLVASYAVDPAAGASVGKEVVLSLPDGYYANISLSQAVRLSSNFPFGFPAVRVHFPPPNDDAHPRNDVEILDGGIVDNTGLDTIHAFFMQLVHDYETEGAHHEQAEKLVNLLKQRQIVLIEIDSGAKPEAQKENNRDGVFSAFTTPLDALNNASYTNSEISRKAYLREINELINNHLTVQRSSSASDGEHHEHVHAPDIPSIHFLCNYKDESSTVMTAWALGPEDKASVIARFVLSWRKQQPGLAELGRLSLREQKLQKEVANLLQGLDQDELDVVIQMNQLEHQVTKLSEFAGDAKTPDVSSIQNALGAVQLSAQNVKPQASPDLSKLENATQNLIRYSITNDANSASGKAEINKYVQEAQTTIKSERDSFVRNKVSETGDVDQRLIDLNTKWERLNQLKAEQSKLQQEFKLLEKKETFEQQKAVDRIKQSRYKR